MSWTSPRHGKMSSNHMDSMICLDIWAPVWCSCCARCPHTQHPSSKKLELFTFYFIFEQFMPSQSRYANKNILWPKVFFHLKFRALGDLRTYPGHVQCPMSCPVPSNFTGQDPTKSKITQKLRNLPQCCESSKCFEDFGNANIML